ncbi:uncharacterized protein si:ch211-178n15.1 [Lampris incognitus]|uniref:uncharacterized protein si:ch211-178n15.1 n=1 Tax=Lampris incognitus TaxID=2546036 RepID=UPI0024B4C507|nr:uncharacterized protein si:ch211-178n15.1 [Lampris incognitus]XP_056149556.1 uncharacterized protein si:ch211-178n15.1 [Lampris incognitus]XP_056149557.1 uncharacterized protein si:ch211-178n15.1 [Lampris incognitus]
MKKTERVNDWAGDSREGRKPVVFQGVFHTNLRTPSDMYADNAGITGHHRFLQRSAACRCRRCVPYEPPYPYCSGPGCRPTPPLPIDHPWLRHGTDAEAPPRHKDLGERALAVDRAERGGRRSPQRRPVFAGPGPYSQPDNLSQHCPWDLNPTLLYYPPLRQQQCGCVVWGDARERPLSTWPLPPPSPPLPPSPLRDQAHRYRRTFKHVSPEEEEEEEEAEEEGEDGWGASIPHLYHMERQTHGPTPGRLHTPNGHCVSEHVRPVYSEGGEEGDSHPARTRRQGGSEGDCNGSEASHKGFFSTEVPPKRLNQSKQKGPRVPPPSVTPSQETAKPVVTNQHQCRAPSDPERQRGSHDSVRDQIRQVVTDLEDVLGGLKQVHVEMKEVVEQIDRLTASINLGDGQQSIARAGSGHFCGAFHQGDPSKALVSGHRPASVQEPLHAEDDPIILRTNSPSPVHTASVVKTNRVAASCHIRKIGHDRPGMNGHPPHLYATPDSNHLSKTAQGPPPQSLDPTVTIGYTSGTRTQKPPPYPQNGRCGKGLYQTPKPLKTSAYPGRGRQSTSMV